MNFTTRLHAAIAAVCPITGVSIGIVNDKKTWRIFFDDAATDGQKQAAQAALNAFVDPGDPKQITLEDVIAVLTPAQKAALQAKL